MADKKIIAVVGSTGAQGGGLVRAIQNDRSGGFVARAITRDASSEKARELASLGAEVVEADIDDPASVERAFRGAHAAYCVTFFWAHFSPERETGEARTMANAAKNAGLQHVIWSTLEDTRTFMSLDDPRMPTLHGKYKVPHFDGKGEADAFFTESGVPATLLRTSFYWENLLSGLGPQRGQDGVLTIAFPMDDKRLPGIAVEDIGRCAYGIFKRGTLLAGRTIGVAGECLTGYEMAASLGRALGEEVRYYPIAPDAFRALGFPGADDLGNMFQFKRDFEAEFCGTRDVAFARELNPQLQTFDQWLSVHARQIPIPQPT